MFLRSALSVLIALYVSSGPVDFLLHMLSALTHLIQSSWLITGFARTEAETRRTPNTL